MMFYNETISLNEVFTAPREDLSFYFAVPAPAADDFISCPVPQISSEWLTFSISMEDTGKYLFLETFKRLSEIVISVGARGCRKLRQAVRSLTKIKMPRAVLCSVTLPLRL